MADDPLSTLDIPWYRTPFFERLILLALPPLGLLLVWTDFERTRGRKIFISIFTGLWLIPYLALLFLGAIGLDLLDLEFKGATAPRSSVTAAARTTSPSRKTDASAAPKTLPAHPPPPRACLRHAARPAPPLLDRLPRAAPRRSLRRTPHPHRLACQRTAPPLAPALRRRLCLLRCRRGPRLHHRTAS
ncbi:MAG: hypothetical protein M5U12_14930 [Verrucomicrobia bacterium]|nr:hypothetical protein [Verrucomicrobiota bacterium]